MGTVVCRMIPVSAMACVCTDSLDLVFSPMYTLEHSHTNLEGRLETQHLVVSQGSLQIRVHISLRLANGYDSELSTKEVDLSLCCPIGAWFWVHVLVNLFLKIIWSRASGHSFCSPHPWYAPGPRAYQGLWKRFAVHFSPSLESCYPCCFKNPILQCLFEDHPM